MSRSSLARSPRLLLLVLLLALVAGGIVRPSAIAAQTPSDDALDAALVYLGTQQTPEGGLDAFGSGADPSTTARAMLALAAHGYDSARLAHPDTGLSPLDYVLDTALAYTHEPEFDDGAHLFPGNAGLVIAALSAAGHDPRNAVGVDLVAQLEGTLSATGAYSTTARSGYTTGEALVPNHAWAVLGLSMAGRSVPESAVTYLQNLQEPAGSWMDGDPDTTGLAIVALLATGQVVPSDAPVHRGLAFLRKTQLPNGGWRPAWDTETLNVDSTGWAIQGLIASGYRLPLLPWKRIATPEDAIVSMQQPNGSLGGTYANAYSTSEGLLGLADRPLFLSPALGIERGLAWISAQALASAVSTGITVDMAAAFVAAGYDPATVPAAGGSLMDLLQAEAAPYAQASVDQAGKLTLLLASLGQESRAFAGIDLIASIDAAYRAEAGAYGVITNTYHQAFPLLALAASDEIIPAEAAEALLALQQPDGGWKYDLTEADWNTTTPDNTALAVQALLAAGIPTDHAAMQRATAYLRSTQDERGGWRNANATAYALQALLALGEDPSRWVTGDGLSPVGALAEYQKADGAFVWTWDITMAVPEDNLLAAAQALPALARRPLTVAPATLRSFKPMAAGADPDGMLPGRPGFTRQDGTLQVHLPFGGDLDRDAALFVEWIAPGMTTWQSGGDVQRADTVLSVAVGVPGPGAYVARLIVLDPDGVMAGDRTGNSAVITAVVPPTVWLWPSRWLDIPGMASDTVLYW